MVSNNSSRKQHTEISQGVDNAGNWQCLLEDLPIMYVYTRTENGQAVIDVCNERFVETLGYDRESLDGRRSRTSTRRSRRRRSKPTGHGHRPTTNR